MNPERETPQRAPDADDLVDAALWAAYEVDEMTLGRGKSVEEIQKTIDILNSIRQDVRTFLETTLQEDHLMMAMHDTLKETEPDYPKDKLPIVDFIPRLRRFVSRLEAVNTNGDQTDMDELKNLRELLVNLSRKSRIVADQYGSPHRRGLVA